jgi:hypothetical protein
MIFATLATTTITTTGSLANHGAMTPSGGKWMISVTGNGVDGGRVLIKAGARP